MAVTLVPKAPPPAPEPNPALIGMLEGLLEAAREGSLESLAYAGTTHEGYFFDFLVAGGDHPALHIALSQLSTLIREDCFPEEP